MKQTAYITASQVLDLLASRHHKDVFVRECKGGPTWGGGSPRLDGWAMRKSWTHPCMWGYEVKVSRSDWLRDQKIAAYLPLCNVLYVVAPSGIVQPEELPDSVGLLVVNITVCNNNAAIGRRFFYQLADVRKAILYRTRGETDVVFHLYIKINPYQLK